MMKPIAVSLSLALLLPTAPVFAAPARWSDAAVEGTQRLRFEKAVLTAPLSTEIGDGITASPGVARLLLRVSGSGFTRVADKDDAAAPLVQFQGAMRSLTRKVAPTVVTILAIGAAKKAPETEALDKLFEDLLKTPNSGPQTGPRTPKAAPRLAPNSPKDKALPDAPKGAPVPDPKAKPEGGMSATGSGVIVDTSDGKPLIVTNAHVVAIAGMNGKVKIFLKGEKPDQGHDGVVLGFNARYDLALVKFNDSCPSCQAAPLGVGDEVEEGDLVLAVGTPFGLPQTKTLGIVSFLKRDVGDKSLVDDFIQTDAAINQGNSGGPLFNIQGRVIAINTQIFSPSGGSVGLAFSIPVRHVVALIERYRRTGAVAASRLGITVHPTANGIEVARVEKDSVSEKIGLAVGDVITALDGVAAPKTLKDFIRAASEKVPGAAVKLTILRGKATLVKSVTAQAMEEMEE
jgi:S1-C subfamily serine protease